MSGWTSTQVRTLQLNASSAPGNPAAWGKTPVEAAITAGVGAAIVMMFHNDPGNGVSNGDSRENHRMLAKQLTDAGILAIVLSPAPVGSTDFTGQRMTGATLRNALNVREYVVNDLPDLFPGQAVGIDVWAPQEDLRAAATAGDILTAFTSDGVHRAAPGSFREARAILGTVGELFVRRTSRLDVRGDNFVAADNQNGNLLKDAAVMTDAGTAMSGTTGGVTLAGVRPALWNVNTSSGLQSGTGITLTGSMRETNGERFFDLRVGAGGRWQGNFEITLGALSLGDLAANDCIAALRDFDIAQGGVGLGAFSMRLLAALPAVSGTAENNVAPIGEGDTATKAWDLILAAERYAGTINGDVGLVVSNDETAITPPWFCRVAPGAAFDFTISVRKLAVRKDAVA